MASSKKPDRPPPPAASASADADDVKTGKGVDDSGDDVTSSDSDDSDRLDDDDMEELKTTRRASLLGGTSWEPKTRLLYVSYRFGASDRYDGGLARYINHSCDPNCVAEVVQIDKEKKIIIISKRFIKKGEELTYDYKFEFETEGSKISCNCGASCCRKWMN
ncbi:histone-lysine N-methyltransferase trr-like [Oscarella lobularis]|uniref:histone-lysine N-methyltransferase trr-like n=1 Tax=Oscarella lobularis TaxID=121494 RepID=UPI003313F463